MNYEDKNLFEILGEEWVNNRSDEQSHVVKTLARLNHTPVSDFTVEDFRFLIAQGKALEILVPMAIEILRKNIFAEGDYYEGDLLYAVISIPKEYWLGHIPQKQEMIALIKQNESEIKNHYGPHKLAREAQEFIK